MSIKGPFYPRQVWKRHWRRIHRWMRRATVHEVKMPEGHIMPQSVEVQIQYRDGEFWYLPPEPKE